MSKFLKGIANNSSSSSSSNNNSSSSDSESEEEQTKQLKQQTQKTENKKKSKFQVLQESNDENSGSSSSEEEQKPEPKKNAKKQSKFLALQGDSDSEKSEDSEDEEKQQQQKKGKQEKQKQEQKSKQNNKNQGKKQSKFQAALDSESEEEEKEKKQEKQEKKPEKKILTKEEKKKLKQKKQEEEEEDIDAILNAAIEEKKKQEAELQKQNEAQKQKKEENENEEKQGDEKNQKPQEKSKAQLKREKKKLKEKQEKEEGTQQKNDQQQQENENESKASKNKKKKGGAAGKPNSKIAEMILQQQKQREEEERLYQEALKKAQEEEERRIAEEKAAEEEKARLKKEEKERKKKAGETMSKAERKKKEKLEKAREQLLRQQDLQQKMAEQQLQKQNEKEEREKYQAEKQEQEKQNKKNQLAAQQAQNANNGEAAGKDKKMSQDSALDNWEDFEEIEEQQKKKQQELEELEKQRQLEQEKKRKNSSGSSGKKKKKSWEYLDEIKKSDTYQSQAPEKGVLRSPIIVIMGHVDTGKTTLLDKLRHTNVQGGEAGGITQQIGATFFPCEKVLEQTVKLQEFFPTELKAPGLLVIDTPGHESFANLRSRGSSLCDFAILVIDLMHGLEQQTMESIKLLTMRKTPFVIALNKIDRCYDWKSKPYESSKVQLQKQKRNTRDDFETRYQRVITQLAKIEKNAILYWDNKDVKSFFPVVPTSGVTGEGIPDLLAVITKYTSQFMKSKMMVKEDAFNCTVMEVKVIEGHGTTIDCILIDGVIRKGDTITILGFNGPITTKIRALLTPHPMKEMRVKGEYIQHDVIYAAMGLKIAAKGLEEAVAGCQLITSKTQEEIAVAEATVAKELEQVKQKIQLSNQGVGVAASTLGSLEALLSFLKESGIPVSYVTIGPVSKDDINKAMKSLLADEVESRKKEYAVMLVFDIKVLKEAAAYAEEQGVKIFTANIIYHLQDLYMEYHRKVIEERRQQHINDAVFPCELSIVKIFRMNKPLILGVKVVTGQLRIGTPLVADINGKPVKIGVVDSMESNGKPVKNGIIKPENGETAVKINEADKVKGGQTFTDEHKLYSLITRHSIDCLKEYFREDVSKQEWKFVAKTLKPYFEIY